jgi:hypothetical protein
VLWVEPGFDIGTEGCALPAQPPPQQGLGNTALFAANLKNPRGALGGYLIGEPIFSLRS